MAKQNKGRKLFATTATAALVASAIVPVASAAEVKDFDQVPAWAKDAVKYLVDNGSVQGDENGKFNPTKSLTRAQAAEILRKELKLEATGTENFSDVDSSNWFYNAVLATSPEIFNGNEKGQFLPNKELTRQEAAKVLVEAYGLTGTASLASFADAASVPGWSKSFLEAAVANGVINGKNGKLAPTDNISNAEFATMVKRAIDAAVTSVTAVSATNATTLTITGNKLGTLKAEDITIDGNSVLSITASENGKTASVKLSNALLLDNEYTVKIKIGEDTKEYKFTYGFAVSTVELVAETKDDDTLGQTVTLKVNGQATDYDTLTAAGYTVEFTAVNSAGVDKTATFFKTVSGSVAVSPVLADNVPQDDYTVEATVRKNGNIHVSDKAVIKVRNIEKTTTSITSESFTNSNTDVAVQKSTTLVTGETLTLNSIKTVNNGVTSTVAYSTGDVSVTSSNPSVLSVNSATGVISANTPGTAELTISYGDFEKKVKYNVTNTARVLTKAVPSTTSATIIANKNTTVNVTAVDQYGDYLEETLTVEAPINGVVTVQGDGTTAGTKDTVVTDNLNAAGTARTGAGTITVAQTGATFGSGTVLVKDSKGKTIGSFTVKTTAVDNVAKRVVELISGIGSGYSDDTTLDISDDAIVGYELNLYTTENVYNGSVDLDGGYTVTYNSDVVIPATTLTSGLPSAFNTTVAGTGQVSKETITTDQLYFQAVGTGTTDVVIYDSTGLKVHQFKLTVTDTDFAITGASLKQNALVDYVGKKFTVSDFLTITASNNDDIVKGIQLNKSTSNVIRIAETATTEAAVGDLYIDVNGNGSQDAGEKILGTAIISIVSGGKGTNFGTAADFTGANLFATGTPAVTGTNDQGTVVFKIVAKADNTKVLASTSVQVKVK